MVTKRKRPSDAHAGHQAGLDFFREHVEHVEVSDDVDRYITRGKQAPQVEFSGEHCRNCPHPIKGLHHYKTGKCKLCRCEGPNSDVTGGYASALAASAPPEKKKARAKKPKPEPLPNINTDFGAALSRDFKRLTKGKKR